MGPESRSYRYPGVQPFRTTDSDIFFGRDDDAERLLKIIFLEKLVVLFGKSGYGKSSLLNAGIIPKLTSKNPHERFQYVPIKVRIGKVSGLEVSPIQKVILKINDKHPDLPQWSFLDRYPQIPSLWYHFKKKQSEAMRKFVLIFDQFEEFFSYGDKDQEAFRWELAQLMYTDIPQAIRENIEDLTDEQYTALSARLDVKVVFSIRSDRLSFLHSMKDALPNILQNTFELNGLRADQAEEAIKRPAAMPQHNRFVTHAFSYDQVAMKRILRELLTVHSDGSQTIEAFHLQIICQACESKIEEKLKAGVVDEEINQEDLPEFHNLYEAYYQRQIEKLPVNLKAAAQAVLEEGLVMEDSQTGECRRLSVDGNILHRQFAGMGVDNHLLSLLEDAFLVRREPNTVGGYSYEIAHDTIVEPIVKIYKQRTRKKAVYKKGKRIFITASILLLVGVLLTGIAEPLYILYSTYKEDSQRPHVQHKERLNKVAHLVFQLNSGEARKILVDTTMGPWEAAQIIAGLKDSLGHFTDSTIKENFFKLTQKSISDSSCRCLLDRRNQKDFRGSGWIISTIGEMELMQKYPCNILNFLLDNQLDDGSWSMFQINKDDTTYGSTYATCHVLRAFHNCLPGVRNAFTRNKIRAAIDKGADWLLKHKSSLQGAALNDYPKITGYGELESRSLSGLAIHTLNIVGRSNKELNKLWLSTLRPSLQSIKITSSELSNVNIKQHQGELPYHDGTRHLVVPWQIIALVDTYKDGNIVEKWRSNVWLDAVIENLQYEDFGNNPNFVNAEIYIALRYLQDKHYRFN